MNSNAYGLDVGTSRVVLASRESDQYQYQSELNAFVGLPYNKITEGVMRKQQVPYSVSGDELVIHGNESEMFADLLGKEVRRPMRSGMLNSSEPAAEFQVGQIMSSMLPQASGSKPQVCFSVPAAPAGAEQAVSHHEASIRRNLNELGYEAKSISEGLAVIYSELEEFNYTGIGVSCGGGLCNVCLAYLSVPVVTFSIPKAGDYIDWSAAQATGELATRVRITKESEFYFNGHKGDRVNQVLTIFYDDMIQSLVNGMRDMFSSSKFLPKFGRRVPMVISGGSAMPQGFLQRFQAAINPGTFPIPLLEVRLAKDPLNATARGALRAALSDA